MCSRNNIFRLMSVVLSLLGSGGCITNMCDNPWLMPVTIPLDVATSPVQLFGGMVFWCAMYEPEKWGSITVTGCDIYGQPITNAILHVDTCVHYGIRPALSDDYRHYEGMTDSEGKVTVKFKRRWQDVDWRLEAPDHYSAKKVTERPENKCKLRRSLKFYPKRNPQPMYAYAAGDWPDIPLTKTLVKKEGYTMDVYPIVEFDLERAEAHVPSGTNFGSRADFRFERYYFETNGVANFYGKMVFAPGCGAYRRKQTGDASFPSCYTADTNAVFETQIDFYTIYDVKTGKTIKAKRLLGEDEFLVLRTRMQVGENGVTNGWHYSKLLGRGRVSGNLYFKQSVFNPRLNDPNLELDLGRNLAGRKYDVVWP